MKVTSQITTQKQAARCDLVSNDTSRFSDQLLQILSCIVEQNDKIIIVTDYDGNIEYVNSEFTKVTGYTLEDVLGKNPRIWKTTDTPPQNYKQLWETITAGGEWQGEFHNKTKNGASYWVSAFIFAVRDHANTITHFVAIQENITEHKVTEMVGQTGKNLLRKVIEHKQTAKALREAQDATSILMNHVPGMVYRCLKESHRTMLLVSDGCFELTGYAPADLIQNHALAYADIIHPDDREMVWRSLQAKDDTCSFQLVYRIMTRNGNEKWVWEQGCGVELSDGTIVLEGFITDITERVRAEEQVKHFNSMLQAIRNVNQLIAKEKDRGRLLQNVCEYLVSIRGYHNAWIVLINDSGELVEMAQAYLDKDAPPFEMCLHCETWNHWSQLALAQPDTLIIKDMAANSADCPPAHLYEGQQAMAIRLEHEGRNFGILTVLVPMEFVPDDEEHLLFKEIAGDIAFALHSIELEEARQAAERALRMSESRLEMALEASSAGVYDHEVPMRSETTYHSERWASILGYSRNELPSAAHIQQWVFEQVHPDDIAPVKQAYSDFIAGRTPGYNIEVKMRHRSGAWINVQYLAHVVERDENGRALRVVGVMQNITNRKRNEEQLHILSRAVEQSPSAVVITDTDANIEYVNPQFTALTGYTFDEALKQNLRLLQPEGHPPAFYQDMWQTVTAGQEWRGELPNRKKNGELFWEFVSISPVRNDEGVITHYLGLKEDITERKLALEAEREQRELAQSLAENAMVISSTLDFDQVMHHILQSVGRVVPHDAARILLIEGEVARVAYWTGYTEECETFFMSYRFPLDTAGLHSMLTTGEPVLISDTSTDANRFALPETSWVRSYVAAPIRARGTIMGFLNLDSASPGFFTETHAKHLQAFAHQAAVAIENAQVYKQLNNYATEMSTLYRSTNFLLTNLSMAEDLAEIGNLIVQAVSETFGELNCSVLLIDPAQNKFIRLARTGVQPLSTTLYLDGPGLIPAAVRTATTIYAPDVAVEKLYEPNISETQSELVIPLQTGKGIIGVLDLQSEKHDAFCEQDRRVLESFAVSAATAIENIQLYEAFRDYAANLEDRVSERTTALARSKERVEAILNSSSDAILILNSHGAIRQGNPAFNVLFGYEPDEVFQQPLTVLIAPEDVEKLGNKLFDTHSLKAEQRLEVVALRKDGTTFIADMATSPIALQGNLGMVCSVRDITARKQTEEALREALERERELGELKSRFVSMASHEFRTPLTTIMSSTGLLELGNEQMTPERRLQHYHKVLTATRHMTNMLDDVLVIGKAEAGKLEFNPELLDIEAFCHELLDEIIIADQTRHPFVFESEGLCGDMLLDEKLMRHILTNLLSNAAKYSPEGKPIHFSLRCEDSSITFRIHDEGIGIPEQDQAQLFEPFHRATNVGTISGTGLGLAITKKSVEQHGGVISFTSNVDAGTTFVVTIPR